MNIPLHAFTNSGNEADGRNAFSQDGAPDHDVSQRKRRSAAFDSSVEPFKCNHALRIQNEEVSGAVWFMNPTSAEFTYLQSAQAVQSDENSDEHSTTEQQPPGTKDPDEEDLDIAYRWTARDNRKGRHSLIIHHHNAPSPSTGVSRTLKGIWRMMTSFSIWDISYLTAITFTTAVVILLTNALLSSLPYITTSAYESPKHIDRIEGALTLAGCSFFLLSSLLTFLEAVNANTKGCFGWKKQHPDNSSKERGPKAAIVEDRQCVHRRNNYMNLFGGARKTKLYVKDDAGDTADDCVRSCGDRESCDAYEQWRFLPTRKELCRNLIYDLGFVASSVMLFSSIIYCSSALAALTTILTMGDISHWIRVPQLIAGLGFATSSCMFMLETQTAWLVPAWKSIGWQVGFWNLIGSIGFTLCAAFGLASAWTSEEWPQEQLAYSYLWGAMSFFLGSLLQWYESLDKHPIEYRE